MTDRAARIAGVIVLVLVLISGARDLGVGLDNWDSYSPVTPGDPLPEFSAGLDDGRAFTPATLEGQVSLLVFWATWCHACELEMPAVTAVARHYAQAGAQFEVYGINRDSGLPSERIEAVEHYTAAHDMDFAQVYDDGELARAFAVEQIPYMVVVDRSGQVRHLHIGRIREQKLRDELDALLAE